MMFRRRHIEVRQEEDTLPWGRVILAFAVVLAIGGALTLWAWLAMRAREADLRPSLAFPEKDLGPRREVSMVQQSLFDEARLGQQLVDAQRAELRRFGVVDRERGIVSIPIDDAIELMVAGGAR
ncbi:hypothetical protein WMF20_24135 [Sorangium sp. So ce834]|uniref:hypothetical protein n=1 Tax=Sorangium sp. So ce834 TaxID=3133321 RepID=UPI003F5DE3BB